MPQTVTIVPEDTERFPNGFPDRTQLRIEWLARPVVSKRGSTVYKDRELVWQGDVEGDFVRTLGEGKYAWSAYRHEQDGWDNFKISGEILVGFEDDKQWQLVARMPVKMQKARLTTDGVAFFCEFPGCNKRTTSKTAALLHESKDHYGIDLVKQPTRKAEVDAAAQKTMEQMQPEKPKKRGPGRPRKNPL